MALTTTATATPLVSIAPAPIRLQETSATALTSRTIVAGVANMTIKVYGFDLSLSSLGSVAIAGGDTNTNILWSQQAWTAGFGVNKPLAASGTDAPEPFAYLTFPVGAAMVMIMQGNLTNVAYGNFLYSQR